MSIENWSDNIVKVELQDDPVFTDDLMALFDQVEENPGLSVVLNFACVNYLNSSNIAKLLKLRKKLLSDRRKLVLCKINTTVWGLFLTTGLDKVFEFAEDLATGLTMVQLAHE